MKRLLVVLLVVAMVFGLATSAFAYTDTKDLNRPTQDAVAKLTALKVVGGYPDGSFGAALEITRAEFSKIACNLAGVGGAAENLGSTPSRFSDVPTGAWHTGWVNLATAQGFVNGYPDGTFKPNNNITMQEVVTVLLRIAGYDDNLPGPWPFDYIAQASRLGITDDVTFVATARANRGEVAVMASNTLDQDVVYWNSDKARFEDVHEPARTLLADSFDATVKENQKFTGWKVTNLANKEVALRVDGLYKNLADTYHISGGYFVNGLNNHLGDIYYNDDDEIIYIDVVSTVQFSDKAKYTYHASADQKVQNLKLDGDDMELAEKVAISDISASATSNTQVQLFLNDDGEVYHVSNIAGKNATGLVIVDKYNTSAQRVETLFGSAPTVKGKKVVVIKDGAFADLGDLERGDVFYRNANVDGTDEVISVSSFKEGELEKATNTKLTIGGTGLLFAGANFTDDDFDTKDALDNLDKIEDAFGTDVKYVTANGNPYKLAFLVVGEDGVGAGSRLYGIVTNATANLDGRVSSLTILNQEGEEVRYDIVKGDAARPEWDDTDYSNGNAQIRVHYGALIDAKVSADGSIDTDDINAINGFAFGATHNGNLAANYVSGGSGEHEIKSSLITIGSRYAIVDSTVVFDIAYDNNDEFDEAELLKTADLADADSVEVDSLVAKYDGANLVAIALYDSSLSGSSTYGVLSDTQRRGSNWYATILGGSEYSTGSSNLSQYVDTEFIEYKISGDKLSHSETIIKVDDGINFTSFEAADKREYVATNGDTSRNGAVIDLVSKSGNTLGLGTADGSFDSYRVNSNTKYYLINEDGEFEESDLGAFYKGDKVIAITTDKPADLLVEYLFLVEYNYVVAEIDVTVNGIADITATGNYAISLTTNPTIVDVDWDAAVVVGGTNMVYTLTGNAANSKTVTLNITTLPDEDTTISLDYTVSADGYADETGTIVFTIDI